MKKVLSKVRIYSSKFSHLSDVYNGHFEGACLLQKCGHLIAIERLVQVQSEELHGFRKFFVLENGEVDVDMGLHLKGE